jgi:thiamine kinase-like enzyme
MFSLRLLLFVVFNLWGGTLVYAYTDTVVSPSIVTMQMEHYLPKDRIESVKKLLFYAFKVPEPERIEPIHGWYDEHILLKLHLHEADYVLRLHHDVLDQEALAREVEIMRIVSLLGLLPHVYATDVTHGMMLVRYIDRIEVTQAQMQAPAMINRIAYLLQKLHRASGFPAHYTPLFARIAEAEATHIKQLSPSLQPIFAYAHRIGQLVSPIAKKAPTHRRLNPNNIIYDGAKLWFVHWNEAGLDDPYIDLASIVIYYQYNAAQTKELLSDYLGAEPTPMELAHLEAMKPVVLINDGLRLIDIATSRGYSLPLIKNLDDLPTLKQFTTHVESGRVVPYLPRNHGLFAMVLLAEATRLVTSPEFHTTQEQLAQLHQ